MHHERRWHLLDTAIAIRAALTDGIHGSAIARPLGAGRHDRPDALCVHAFPVSGIEPARAVLVLEPLPSDEARERAKIQVQIKELNEARKKHVAKVRREQTSSKEKTLDDAVIKNLRQQAEKKGIKME